MEKTINKTEVIIHENEKLIANILHDIKSPLYSIKIGLQNKLDCELNRDIFETTLDLIEYIENFLVSYSFREGKFNNKIIPCDVKKIIDKKIENYKYIFIDKNIHIDMYFDKDEYYTDTIEIFLSSIIGNIISNMALHGLKSQNASIAIYSNQNWVIVNFKNYYKDENSNTNLGLDFCRKLAQNIKVNLKYTKTKNEVLVDLKIPSLKNSKKEIIEL